MRYSEHRRINKRCVSVRAFEEEPEYYSFSDNYDYGDVDYGQDYEYIFIFFIFLPVYWSIFHLHALCVNLKLSMFQ